MQRGAFVMSDSVRDLGDFDAPLIVFGGTYGNLEATETLFREAERLGITPDRMIHTGDVVAYAADAQATADLIRRTGIPVIMGNCEEALGTAAEDCGCGFEEGSACDVNAKTWYDYCSRMLDAETKRWMAELPRRIAFRLAGVSFAAVHGTASRINQFVFGSTPDDVFFAEIERLGAEGVVSGHSGIPFIRHFGAALWVNAGALGMPANDGTRRVWYAVLRPTAEGIAIECRPLDYDWAKAAAKMRAVGLPPGYASALETGLWDSCEILPQTERRARGKALNSLTLRYNRTRRAA